MDLVEFHQRAIARRAAERARRQRNQRVREVAAFVLAVAAVLALHTDLAVLHVAFVAARTEREPSG